MPACLSALALDQGLIAHALPHTWAIIDFSFGQITAVHIEALLSGIWKAKLEA